MKPRATIAMAVYNGEKYIHEQIDSILCQIGSKDELIISVDPCNDRSMQIALEYSNKDGRIRVYDGPGKGVIKNFENALSHADGDYILISDQDDVWFGNKLNTCLEALKRENALAVIHDAVVADESLNTISKSFFENGFYSGILKNIIRNRYIGCCMAFKKALLDYALPFPKNLPMHDQWLGITAKKFGGVSFIDKPLMYYRRHKDAVTGQKRSGLWKMIHWRVDIATDYLKLGKEYAANK